MRPLLVTALLLVVGLAGCSGGGGGGPDDVTSAECLEQGLILNETAEGGPACVEAPFEIEAFEDTQHHCVRTQQRDRVHAPDLVGNPWQLGDFWEYSLAINGADLGVTKLVYYDDQDFSSSGVAQHYMVGTPTREEALRHAIFSENPMIGRVHRILYSPHESGDHADMFHFPLCDGSTWTTVFYDEQFQLAAVRGDVQTPSGLDDGFLIRGSSAEGSTLSLAYSPAVQWFTFIDLDRGDGSAVDLVLEGRGSGYAGDAFFLRGQNDERVALAVDLPAGPGLSDLLVPRDDGRDGPYDTIGLAIDIALNGTGAADVELLDPNGESAWSVGLGGAQGEPAHAALLEVPYVAGDWTIRVTGIGADPTSSGTPPLAQVTGTMTFVSIYDRSGSV